jgi:glucose-1-phosphate thymidylyltransferase
LKAVLPVAGIGTRLRPQTNSVPKVLVNVAGKPMLGHIVDDLLAAGIKDMVFIVGYLKEQIQKYIKNNYPSVNAEFVEQKEMLGLGHAIYMAKELSGNDDLLIILGDTIYDVDLKKFLNSEFSSLGLKKVSDPRRFGVAETDIKKRFITKLVEKPEAPKSNLAIVGLYYIKNSQKLFDALNHIIENNLRTKNEYQLTDALQYMIENGEQFTVSEINGWYDCGLSETLLDTNEILLKKKNFENSVMLENSILIEPSAIHPSVKIINSVVGPYVSVGKNTIIENSVIKNSIISEDVLINSQLLDASIIGANSSLKSEFKSYNIGAHASLVDKK